MVKPTCVWAIKDLSPVQLAGSEGELVDAMACNRAMIVNAPCQQLGPWSVPTIKIRLGRYL